MYNIVVAGIACFGKIPVRWCSWIRAS